ncbi:MAG: 1-acyl-sn-glycerol-3-phosphate acyltransferase [Pseudomonadales bacterium]|nr:1-acyl-sn-glycerol-3-phosphate acyltransferase [Pseudomonadales bacterium]
MLQSLIYRAIAVTYIAFIFLTSLIFFLAALMIFLVTAPFDRRLTALHQFTCFWATLYIWVMPPWSVSIEGKENIDANETYVIVSNHQSLVDILVAFTLFTHFKWVSKAELFSLPFIGWNMSLNRYIRLRRGNPSSIKQMYASCEKHLNQGSSVYLFPEGTRSESGHMRPFKEGAFVLAKRLDRPILPIVINGSMTAVPKGSFNFHGKTHVRVSILPAIPAETFKEEEARVLADRVHGIIEDRVVIEPESN